MLDITPTDEQQEAINAVVAWHPTSKSYARINGIQCGQELILDGAAGTGKTTTASLAIEKLNLKNVVFGAYTAKAARVMERKGMAGARTLHSLLYRPIVVDGRVTGWRKANDSPCDDAQLIVIDEVSMCSELIAADLKSFGRPILVLGDIDGQLPPPTGAGAFQGRAPNIRLHEPHRTVAESPIARLAWTVRRGGRLNPGGPDEARVEPLTAGAWEHILNRDNQVICGKHKTRITVTRRARAHYGFDGHMPCVGEPLVCRRNDMRQGLINGQQAVLWRVTEEADDWFEATLLFDGEEREGVKISRDLFRQHFMGKENAKSQYNDHINVKAAQFDWAYAITAHSAQGDEWDRVVVIDDQFARWDRDLRRRWLYTSVTRARDWLRVYTTG